MSIIARGHSWCLNYFRGEMALRIDRKFCSHWIFFEFGPFMLSIKRRQRNPTITH